MNMRRKMNMRRRGKIVKMKSSKNEDRQKKIFK